MSQSSKCNVQKNMNIKSNPNIQIIPLTYCDPNTLLIYKNPFSAEEIISNESIIDLSSNPILKYPNNFQMSSKKSISNSQTAFEFNSNSYNSVSPVSITNTSDSINLSKLNSNHYSTKSSSQDINLQVDLNLNELEPKSNSSNESEMFLDCSSTISKEKNSFINSKPMKMKSEPSKTKPVQDTPQYIFMNPLTNFEPKTIQEFRQYLIRSTMKDPHFKSLLKGGNSYRMVEIPKEEDEEEEFSHFDFGKQHWDKSSEMYMSTSNTPTLLKQPENVNTRANNLSQNQLHQNVAIQTNMSPSDSYTQPNYRDPLQNANYSEDINANYVPNPPNLISVSNTQNIVIDPQPNSKFNISSNQYVVNQNNQSPFASQFPNEPTNNLNRHQSASVDNSNMPNLFSSFSNMPNQHPNEEKLFHDPNQALLNGQNHQYHARVQRQTSPSAGNYISQEKNIVNDISLSGAMQSKLLYYPLVKSQMEEIGSAIKREIITSVGFEMNQFKYYVQNTMTRINKLEKENAIMRSFIYQMSFHIDEMRNNSQAIELFREFERSVNINEHHPYQNQ